MRPILTISVVAINRTEFQALVRSIERAKFNGKTQLLVVYSMERKWVKSSLEPLRRIHPEISITLRRLTTEFRYPRDIFRLFLLKKLKIFQKKVVPFRVDELRMQRIGYEQSNYQIRGKYLMILPRYVQIKENFWEHTISHLERNKQATIMAASVEQLNADKIGFIKKPIGRSTVRYPAGEGVFPFLHGTHISEKIIIAKRKRMKWCRDKYLFADDSADKYIFDHAVACRLALSEGILQSEYVAEMKATDKVIERFESLESVILRLAYLKGYVWHYDARNEKKYNMEYLKAGFQGALKSFPEVVKEIRDYYRKENDDILAEKYDAFMNSVLDD